MSHCKHPLRFYALRSSLVRIHARWLPLILAFAVGISTVAFAQPPGTNEVIRAVDYDFAVTQVPQGTTIEFTPIDVGYSLSLSWIGGKVGDAALIPSYLDVCPALMRPETACRRIDNPRLGYRYTGQIRAMAPPAGQSSDLRIVLLKPGELFPGNDVIAPIVVRYADAPMKVAARYDVAITGFTVITTRSTVTDTIWISLLGMVTATPLHPSANADEGCKRPGFNWCIFRSDYGDAGDGYHAVSNVRVEAFDLVPEVEDDLRFLFHLDNTGDSELREIGEGVANGFSKAGMVILGAWGALQQNPQAGQAAGQIDQVMEKFHSLAFASCDGTVASDSQIITNKTLVNRPENTLAALTGRTGSFTDTIPKVDSYRNKDGDFRCDRRGGQYSVTYTVYRTSWQPWGWQPTY